MNEPLSLPSILFVISMQFAFFLMIKKFNFQRFFSYYESIQKIHSGQILRVGGLLYFIGLLITYIFFVEKGVAYLNSVILCSSILFLLTFTEDVKHILSAKIRLLILLSVSLIFITTNDLPEIRIFNIKINSSDIILYQGLFVLALITLMNGFNFIDGLNGLSSFNFVVTLLSIYLVAYWNADKEIVNLTLTLILLSIVFAVINFPFGLIFLGDSGSYLYAFLSGAFTIILFEKNPELPSTLAILILAYPATEVIFSFFRKILNKKSPLKPDVNHFHHLVLKKLGNKNLKNNNLASILMFPIWLSPLFLVIFSYHYKLSNLTLYLGYFIFYSSSYYILKKSVMKV